MTNFSQHKFLPKPTLAVGNRSTDVNHELPRYRVHRVQIDNKELTVIDYTLVEDIHALMVRKFGAERVGNIQESDSSKIAV